MIYLYYLLRSVSSAVVIQFSLIGLETQTQTQTYTYTHTHAHAHTCLFPIYEIGSSHRTRGQVVNICGRENRKPSG